MSTNSSKGAAIVTGAAQGLGKAIAIRLAKDGYDIALNDIEAKRDGLQAVAREIELFGRKSIIVVADVTDEDGVAGMIKRTVTELGILRVMVANAGISLTVGTECLNLSLKDFEMVLKVNLVGVFLCYREAARQMVRQSSWGRIIGASSAAGRQGGIRSTGYSASKFGIVGITQCLAAEMVKYGVTVNTYAPGLIDTPMAQQVAQPQVDVNMSEEERVRKLSEAVTAATGVSVPAGKPGDVAGLVSYLASEESKFITGQTISVNGGTFFG